jgi:exonuclease SbcD
VGAEQSTRFLREPVLPLSEIRGLPFGYQAWGHLHRAQTLAPHIRYAGSIERIDFAEADEDKGWWSVELPITDRSPILWRSSQPRRFVDLEFLELPEPSELEARIAREIARTNSFLQGAVVRVRYTATPEEARTVDHGGIRRTLYAAGAAKVHGPFADIRHTVTEQRSQVDEETSPLAGWREWATARGIVDPDYSRLDARVQEALEVMAS